MAGPRIGDLADVGSYELPDVGPPLLPPGPQFSPGLPAVNAMAENWGRPQPVPEGATLFNTKAGPITEGDLARAMDVGLSFSGGGLSTKPIKAYHSSPHDFEKFDLSKIGTGEGAQVYGHGLYFAESPAVSGQGGEYWRQFLNRFEGPENWAANLIKDAGFDRVKAAKQLQNEINGLIEAHKDNATLYAPIIAKWQQQLDLLKSGQPVGPRTYEVGIHADPQAFLNWDVPFAQQSPQLQSALTPELLAIEERARAARERLLARPNQFSKNAAAAAKEEARRADMAAKLAMKPEEVIAGMEGPSIYRALGTGAIDQPTGFRIATQKAQEAGVPGIRYLDQHSRNAAAKVKAAEDMIARSRPGYPGHNMAMGMLAEAKAIPQTSNYVVFDPAIVEIMKKYGIVGAPAGTLGALAAQDQYRAGE